MARVLVTGYTGFLGNHVVDALKSKHALHLLGRREVGEGNYFYGEIDSFSDYSLALKGVDTVIHCAARVHMMDESEADAEYAYTEVNVLGTMNLAEQAKKAGVKKFIFISSIKVNGESTSRGEAFSDSSPCLPEDAYGRSKLDAENGLLALVKKSNMDVVIVRPPLIYGKDAKGNFASLFKVVNKRIPLPLRLVNKNKRSFVSVYNLVNFIEHLVEYPSIGTQVLLISDGEDLSTAQLVSLIAKVHCVKDLSLPVPVWMLRLLLKVLGKKDVAERLLGSLRIDMQNTEKVSGWTPPYSVLSSFEKCVKK